MNKQNNLDFFNQRFILWTNINLFNRAFYKELNGHCCPCQDTIIESALKENYKELWDLREKLDFELEQPIISIDFVCENGEDAMDDSYVYPECNLRYCLRFDGNGAKEWYIDDKGDLRSYEVNEDGSRFRLYRMLKATLTPREVESFKEDIFMGQADWRMIERYTESIGQIILKVTAISATTKQPALIMIFSTIYTKCLTRRLNSQTILQV